MSTIKGSQRWHWTSTAVFLIGILSITLLLWVNRINDRQRTNSLIVAAFMDAQINVTTGHLWLEEALGGDNVAKEALSEIDQAINLVDAALSGGKSDHGLISVPLKDPTQRSRLDEIKTMIMKYRVLAQKRLRNPVEAGVGSAYDQKFDALFKDILAKTSALENAVDASNRKDQAKSRPIFLGILSAWALLVAAATAGLWKREKRRTNAEEALLNAHGQLLAQAEELTAHRERLAELVETRTAELTAANTLLRNEIAERRNLENQLCQSQKMEGIGQLAGGVAHDFNNILTAIIGYGNLAVTMLKNDEKTMECLEEILAAADRATHLTHGLLAFSRKQLITLQPANLNSIVSSVEKMLGRLISEEIELKTRLSDEDLIVMADPGQIDQVIINLATNARDAMPDGGSLIIETSRFAMTEDYCKSHGFGTAGEYALLTVSDSGQGMDEAIQTRIFEPFFTTKEVGKGTGLGLSIVFGIIKQHNGFVTVYSETGCGSTFKIYLSLAKGEAAAPIRPTEVMEAVAGGNETVLVVEDNEAVRNFTRTLLEQNGYRVLEAVDGQNAVTIFGAHRDEIRLVIMDVVMPKMNGKEALTKIQSIRPDVVALFTSGYTADVINRKGVMEDINFISKPAPPQALLRKVRELLDVLPPEGSS